MQDEEYFSFIEKVMMSLEPRKIEEDDEIIPYQDNVYEMFFMSSGKYEIGYRFMGKEKMCVSINC